MASDDEPPTAGEDAEDDLSSSAGALFTEPAGYFKPEKQPTEAEYTLRDGRVLRLGLVGESPLWVRLLNIISLSFPLLFLFLAARVP